MAPQLPNRGEIFLDHTAFFAPAIEPAAAVLEACGFRLTPFTIQTNRDGGATVPSGTGNRCAMLRNGYLELLAATSDTPLSAQLRERVADHPGLHLAAFAAADAAAEHRRLGAAGFPTLPLVDMRRPVTAADGTEDFARFTIARVAHGTMPEGRAQFLSHHTEALVWPAAMLDHPNGTQALSALWIAADDPAEAAERFARFTGRAAGRNGAVMTLALDRGHLRFAAPSWVEERLGIDVPGSLPSIVAAEVASAGLRETETLLRAAGFSVRAHDYGLTVNLPPALGGALIFSGADTEGGR